MLKASFSGSECISRCRKKQWHCKKDYIIRYTTDPKCLSELGLEAEKTKLKTLSFPQPKKGEKIFIRACGAKEIEYAIASNEDGADSMIKDNRKTISFE